MAEAGIATVRRMIEIAVAIQDLGNNCYIASADWDVFPLKIVTLKRKHDFFSTKEFARSAILCDGVPMETLGEVERLLEQERAELERRGFGANPYFPPKIGLGIQQVIDAFDAIPGFLQQEEEAAVALENRMMGRARSLSFRDDGRYVPLKLAESESKVYAALEDPNGSQLILLHGGPDKGKSALARRVALQYHWKCKNPKENPGRQFDLVVFLECGPKADILASQLKLANLISSNSGATADLDAQGITESKEAIEGRLKGLLKHQRILIELDDVCKPEFLQEMLLLCGDRVKCLVTSQDRDLCRNLSLSRPAVQILIEDTEDDVAIRILASLVGFPDTHIPAHIQRFAQKVILDMENHPLALASVAKEVDPDGSHELEQWEAASESFLTKLLDMQKHPFSLASVAKDIDPDLSHELVQREAASVSPSFLTELQSMVTKGTFVMPCPESTWLTQRSIDEVRAVSPDAPTLLILLHMCEGRIVPEEVLKILFCGAVSESGSDLFRRLKFHLSKRALMSRGLVVMTTDEAQSCCSWIIHFCVMEFVKERMNDEKEKILKILGRKLEKINSQSAIDLSAKEDRRIWISLYALYFRKHFFEKINLEINIPLYQLRSVRWAIEPITRLLALPVGERWSERTQSAAKQVYLRYIYDFALHESGIVYLMASPVSVLPMLQAAARIAALVPESAPGKLTSLKTDISQLQFVDFPRLLDQLANFLSKDHSPDIRTEAARAFGLLSEATDYAIEKIVACPAAVQSLIASTSMEDRPALQLEAARALFNLTCSRNNITKRRLVDFPGLLEQLVNLLSKDHSIDLRTQAAMALENLTYAFEYGRANIVACPDAVKSLLASISLHDRPGLQLEAAMALVNLTCSGNDIIKRRLVDFAGLLEQFVNVLSKDQSLHLQTQATMAFENLAYTFEYGRANIVAFPDAVKSLLALTFLDDRPVLQHQAARALVNLTYSENDITHRRLVDFPGLLEQLVNLLSKDHSLDLRTAAVKAFGNLAYTFEYGRANIVACANAVQSLLALTSLDDRPALQLEAARALVNLTCSDNDITHRRLVDLPGFLEQLVNLLSKDHSIDLRTQAAVAMENLAYAFEYGRANIITCPDAVKSLLALTSLNDRPALQFEAARALFNLTCSENDITKRRLVDFPGLLEQLVKLLSEDRSLDLRTQVAMVFVNLACTFEYGTANIVACPDAVKSLLASTSLASISLDEKPSLQLEEARAALQLEAARALVNLTSSDNDVTHRQLVDFPGSLEQLVNLLSKDHSLDLRTIAAMAFTNLARTFEYGRAKIVACPNAVESLLASTCMDDSPGLQLEAARALFNLTASESDSTRGRLVDLSGLLEQLVKLSSKDHNPNLRTEAAMALQNLASCFPYGKEKIVSYEQMEMIGPSKIANRRGTAQFSQYETNAKMKDTAEEHLMARDATPDTKLLNDFIATIDEKGEDGFFVSSEWLLGLQEEENRALMSVLEGAGYGEACQTSTTTLFARMENYGGRLFIPSVKNVDNLARGMQTLKIDNNPDTASVSGAENEGKSSGATDDATQVATWEAFQAATKSKWQESFCVSTQWLSNLKEQKKEALLQSLREAEYVQISQTSMTTWYARIRGEVRVSLGGPAGANDGSRSSSRSTSAGGNLRKRRMCNSFKRPRAKRNASGQDDQKSSSGPENRVETGPIPNDTTPECRPQLLKVECSSSSSSTVLPTNEDSTADFSRYQFGESVVTIPRMGPSRNISTSMEKPFSIPMIDYTGDKSRESNMDLKAVATTSLSCCVKVDCDLQKVRFKFSQICGEARNVKPEEEWCNAMVVSSVYTSVSGCSKTRTDGEGNMQPIVLFLDDEYYRQGGRRVSEGDASTGDLVWMEKSGRTPENCEPGSTTVVLQRDINSRRLEDSGRPVQGAYPLLFQKRNPVAFEGEVDLDHHPQPGSYLQFRIRCQLQVAYYKAIVEGGPVCKAIDTTKLVDFGCFLTITTPHH